MTQNETDQSMECINTDHIYIELPVTPGKVCPICSKELPPNGNLSFHMMLHPSGKPYACDYCLQIFKTKEDLKKHIHNDHPELRSHLCEDCGRVFSHDANLKRHRALNHLNLMRYKCMYCDTPFKEYGQYRTHEAGHDKITNFQCSSCKVYFGNEKNLKMHLDEHECSTKVLTCCKITFCTRLEFVTHTLLRHKKYKTAAQKCQYCGKTFPFSCAKRDHEEICSNRNGNPGESNSIEPDNDKEYPCDHCDRTFPSYRGFLKHYRSHIGVNLNLDKQLTCTVCNKKLATPASLYVHKSRHLGIKRFFCEFCNKGFFTRTLMISHRVVHTKERPFKCRHCDRNFPYRNSMLAHERSHTGERPFPCKYCDQRFNRYSAMQNHERRHTGEKPYSCRICGKAFLQHSTWRQHERTHNDRIECEKCSCVFATRKEYKLHKKFSQCQPTEVRSETVEENVEQIWGQPAEMSTDKDGNVYVYYQVQ